ncbi:MAG: N-formylglutamate amidohydrolase [Phenylobacterium sp.]|uniref:N-formylglutamate amidohydrolase n=1 Tax=Phenylobacterium sp. TaxID=1871053 RepID=UPI001A4613D1|nr:N-formylglutamate amidohydrolase [Phenylobacterium sp.]MBL8771130.1 N-formylglutamate amidohydrolase [Phenylobacterium sp.]
MLNPGAPSGFLLVGDHAGDAIPPRLGDLGVGPADRARHIACDLGVAALGRALSVRLDATFISQRYSRLVIDCNRSPDHPQSIVETSDGTSVPGNAGLGDRERVRRRREIFEPYHAAIAAALDARPGRRLVSLHSFTPVMQGQRRPWRLGVLHRDDSPLSRSVLARLRGRLGEAVGDNEPYRMDGDDFTVPHHCDPRGLDYLELEVRQDELAHPDGVAAIAALVADALV